MAAKRISSTSVNWQKLADKLIPKHEAELTRLKGQSTLYSAKVNNLPADLPKIDFVALKKQLPEQASILDGLQKQYEALSIPYGAVPDALNAEVDKWTQYNEARKKLYEVKAADGAVEANKVEEKWAKAPPILQFTNEHFAEYFPKQHHDYRYSPRIPDPANIGFNEYEHLEARFKDYKILPRPDWHEAH